MNAPFMLFERHYAAFTSYEGMAGSGSGVTGVHKRLCGTTGTAREPRARAGTGSVGANSGP